MTDTGPATDPAGNSNLEQLRAKAARADELEQKLRDRDRQDTFSGLNVTDGQGKMLAELYEQQGGEFNRDAFAQFASGYGVELESLSNTPPPAPPAEQQVAPAPVATPEEQAHFQTLDTLGTEVVNQETEEDHARAGWQRRDELLKSGGRAEKADLEVVRGIFGAANAGDPKYLYNQAQWREAHE